MNIVANGRMTEAQYDRERAKIAPTKREAMNESGVRWEQQLAELFYRSGWSAPQLRQKIGDLSRHFFYISNLLVATPTSRRRRHK
jgi:hypothetical protein